MKNETTQKQFKSIYRWLREVMNKCITSPVTLSLTNGFVEETKTRYLSFFIHFGDDFELFSWMYDEPIGIIAIKKQGIINFLHKHGIDININL
ncbi:MAG: hypothetical protein J6T35_01395 [Bacteroidales bacterium]|nr:hypothetical protein [Bacteroidales bacterium]